MTDPLDPEASVPDTPVGPPRPPFADDDAGAGIARLDLAGTVVFAVITLVTSLFPGTVTDVANLVVSLALLLGGCVAFAVGFLRAVGRSEKEVVDLAGLFYLTGSGPQAVRRRLLGLWFVQIAIAVISVFTVEPPFGVLATVWGIGLIPVWAARHGSFPPRPLEGRRHRQ